MVSVREINCISKYQTAGQIMQNANRKRHDLSLDLEVCISMCLLFHQKATDTPFCFKRLERYRLRVVVLET